MTVLLHRRLNLRLILKDYPVVIVPGLRDSDAQHWQSLWHAQIPTARRVSLDDWKRPDLTAWQRGIEAALTGLDRPAIIIAHSFGTLASAAFAATFPEKVAGLFLVAPADPDKFGIRAQLPQRPLPVPSKIVASSNDPWLSELKAAQLALSWGTDYVRFKDVGHINSDSGLGAWPAGVHELQQWITQREPARAA